MCTRIGILRSWRDFSVRIKEKIIKSRDHFVFHSCRDKKLLIDFLAIGLRFRLCENLPVRGKFEDTAPRDVTAVIEVVLNMFYRFILETIVYSSTHSFFMSMLYKRRWYTLSLWNVQFDYYMRNVRINQAWRDRLNNILLLYVYWQCRFETRTIYFFSRRSIVDSCRI